MRAVPSVKDQFMTFVEEVLPHKPKKNADCTGAEAVHEKVSGFKLFLDGDRGKREREIAPLGLATWHEPKGGYFVSVNTEPGLAKRTLALCKEAGVVMTGAGATFPYGVDPQDSNIRIAPSLPPVSELEKAMEVFCVSLRIAALEKLLA